MYVGIISVNALEAAEINDCYGSIESLVKAKAAEKFKVGGEMDVIYQSSTEIEAKYAVHLIPESTCL